MAEANTSAVQATWRESAAPREQAQRATLARRYTINKLLLCLLVFLGLLTAVLIWLSPMPQPYFTGTWITDYQARQIPLPPQNDHDRDAINQGKYFERQSPQVFQSLERAVLVQELTDLGRRSPLDTVVIYLNAQARYGAKGEVYLFVSDAHPANPQTWLPLRQVLEMVQACPAHAKLVVLDVMQPLADPRLGILSDDVSRAVHAELQTVDDPHRLVLCASSPEQVALASQVMGRTVFGYYFEEALRGWADGYGGRHAPDRRVHVRELADFLQARVDRWTWHNRQSRQTPILIGSGADFPLLVLPKGQPQPHLTEAKDTPYPAWLLSGWKMRDTWLSARSYRDMPHLFRELETVLLDADKEWHHGIYPDRSRENRSQQLKNLDVRQKLFRFPPEPEPYALAQAVAQGRKPDKETYDLLQGVLAKRQTKTDAAPKADPAKTDAAKTEPAKTDAAADKQGQDALEKLRAKPHFDVAWAAFELTAADPTPQPDKIRMLNALLQMQEARPRYVETLFMQRLGDLATQVGDANWPQDTVRRALEAVRLGERAIYQPEAFAWIRGPLEEASQKRYEAETLLFARGYVDLAAVEQDLRQAIEGFEICSTHAETIEKAHRILDDALAFLPTQVPYIERVPSYEKDWLEAVQATDQLYRLLIVPTANGQAKPAGREDLRQRGEEVRNKTEELYGRLEVLRRPFAADAVKSLKGAADRADTGTFHLLEIESLLATPNLTAADRQALWQAQRGLARRLHQQTRDIDIAEDEGKQSITARFGPEGDPQRQARLQRQQTARRARLSIALLRMAGLAATELQPLEEALHQAEQQETAEHPGPAPWYALGQSLRQVWVSELPARLSQEPDGLARDRLSRVFSLLEVGLIQPDPAVTPHVLLRQQQARALWSWLADRYRYANRDIVHLGPTPGAAAVFTGAAARSYQQLAGAVPEEEYVQILAGSEPLTLPPGSGSVRMTLKLRLYAPASARTDAVLRIFTADDAWLQITPEIKDVEPGTQTVPIGLPFSSTIDVPLRVALRPGAVQSKVPPPAGFLVEVQVNGRSYHRLIPVALQSVTDRLLILLSANNREPTDPIGDLRLRPVKPRQSFYLYVRNPTTKARNLIVQLLANDNLIEGAEAKLAVGSNETARVVFPLPPGAAVPPPAAGAAPPAAGAAPPAPADLPTLPGPLEVRLLDPANRNTILEKKFIQVGVASPREYVQVTNILFSPPNPRNPTIEGKNRLAVSLRTSLTTEPACLAELILPPDRIPGFLGVKDGNMKGEIPLDGTELRLYADNLRLIDGEDEEGYAYINVDTFTRAFVFRTTFARGGEPTSPREDNQPAVRLRAPRFAVTGAKVPVDIEVDNAPTGSTLEVSLGRLLAGAFEPETQQKLPSGRQTRVGFSPSSQGGGLQFEAAIQDWHLEMDTFRIKGPRTLLARLRDSAGNLIRTAELNLLLDDSPPERARFVDPPKYAKKDAVLTLQASCAPPLSGLSEVNFFVGRPVNNKIPPNTPTAKGTPVDDTGSVWTVKVPMGGDRKGPLDISVEFKSMTGLTSFATMTVDLLDGDPPREPGIIEGKVLEGTRPQAGLRVILRDEKGQGVASTVTDEEGAFRFTGVTPGKFRISASKPASRRKGEESITVEPGQTTTVEIGLLL